MFSVDFHLERLFNLTCTAADREKELPIPLKGINFTDCLVQRSIELPNYTPETIEERFQIGLLFLHRHRLANDSVQVYQSKNNPAHIRTLIGKIQGDIERLAGSQGRSMFFFPGGTPHHAICYGFAKEADGSYSFLIYNRGEGWDDPELHGNVLLVRNGKQIVRTRVQICELAKEDLQDEGLLEALIVFQHDLDATMENVYRKIKECLLDKALGLVREAPGESEWLVLTERLSLDMNESDFCRLQLIEDELMVDPAFHSLPVSGSSVESNAEAPEHYLVEPNLRRKLKLSAIKTTYEHVIGHIPESLTSMVSLKILRLRDKILFWRWTA